MAEAKGALEAKEIEEFGVRLTIFSNGDVYVSTPADIHIIQVRHVFWGLGWEPPYPCYKEGKGLD